MSAAYEIADVIVTGPETADVVTAAPQGPTGATGATGGDGDTGPAGPGVPTGGTAGQFLKKNSGTNYDTAWADVTGGGSDVGEVLAAGLSASDGAANRTLIIDQGHAAALDGKRLLIPRGNWPIAYTGTPGSGVERWGIRPTSTAYPFRIGFLNGAWLYTANNQIADGELRTGLFFFRNHVEGVELCLPYGGVGGISGNTANQPGYTTASGEVGTRYSQTSKHDLIAGWDTAGNGSFNVRVFGLKLYDTFTHPVSWAGEPNGATYDPGTADIVFENLYCTDFGEGPIATSVSRPRFRRIDMVFVPGKTVGDGAELSVCTDIEASDIRGWTPTGAPITTGGAVVDAYASKRGTISRIFGRGTGQLVTLQSDFNSPTTNYCDDLLVTDIEGVDCSSITIFPNERGHCTFDGVKLTRCGVSANNPWFQMGEAHSSAKTTIRNLTAVGCTGMNFGRAGATVVLENVELLDGVGDAAIGVSASVNLHVNGLRATGYENGAQLSGSAAPAGTWRGVNFAGCTYLHLIQGTATLENVYIPDGLEGGRTAYFVGYEDAPPQTLKPWQGITRALGFYTDRSYTTIGGAGHKGQEIEIGPSGQNATLVHGTTLRLRGGANFRYLVGDVIRFRRDDTTPTVWHETYRSENVARVAGLPTALVKGWWKANDATGSDGTDISSIVNRGSVGGNFAPNSYGGTRTAPKIYTVAGRKVLRFVSTSNLYRAMTLGTRWVCLVRFAPTTMADLTYLVSTGSATAGADMRLTMQVSGGGNWGTYGSTDRASNTNLDAGVRYCCAMAYDSTAADPKGAFYLSGAADGTFTESTGGGDLAATSGNGLYVGGLNYAGTWYGGVQADIEEVMFLDGWPSRDDLDRILNYMAAGV